MQGLSLGLNEEATRVGGQAHLHIVGIKGPFRLPIPIAQCYCGRVNNWGRDDRLWWRIAQGLNYSGMPHRTHRLR